MNHAPLIFRSARITLRCRVGNLKRGRLGHGRDYSVLSHNGQSGSLVLDNEDVFLVMRPVGVFQMNEYFLACKKTGEAALVDSGESSSTLFFCTR